MKILNLLVLLFLLTACSLSSQNFVSESTFLLCGGKQGRKVWSENLSFKRISWIKQTSLAYDVMLAKVEKNSPFYGWFSEEEKNRLFGCKEVYVFLDYSLDSTLLPHSIVQEQMHKQGFSEVMVSSFFQQLKNHPQYKTSNLTYYSFKGYCRNSHVGEELKLELPGF